MVPEGVKLCGHTVFLYAQLAPDDLNQITIFQAVKVLVDQLCLTLCNLLDCNPPGSSVHGILQAIILEWLLYPLLQGIFLTQRSNPGSPASQADSLLAEL